MVFGTLVVMVGDRVQARRPRSASRGLIPRGLKGTARRAEVQNLVKTFDGEREARGQPEPSSNGRRCAGLRRQRHQLHGRAGRAVHAARPVGLRQDDDAALDRGPRDARRRARSRRRRGRSSRRATATSTCPPNKRGLGMVFQSYAIWPHMTVFENVAFPLQVRPRDAAPGARDHASAVDRVLATVQLRPARRPAGDQALAAGSSSGSRSPAPSSSSRRCCCSTSRCRTSTPSCARRCASSSSACSASSASPRIYVTHDQIEALAMSNARSRSCTSGEIVQVGKPREIYETPQRSSSPTSSARRTSSTASSRP